MYASVSRYYTSNLLYMYIILILMNSFNIFDFIFSVSLQPFEYDPQEKNRHKFMVQSMFAPEGDLNQDTLVNISLKTLHNKLKMH